MTWLDLLLLISARKEEDPGDEMLQKNVQCEVDGAVYSLELMESLVTGRLCFLTAFKDSVEEVEDEDDT